MQFDILNIWSGEVQFTAEIHCSADESRGVKLGMAVKAACKRGADLSGAVLSGAILRHADLRDASLSSAILTNAILAYADLRNADLSDAFLPGAIVNDADLRHANLSSADLRHADFTNADFTTADLRCAVLRCADLRAADLSYAVLDDADLRHANLRHADLRGAYFRDLRDVPIIPDIHQTVYAVASRAGALEMGTWHSDCGTTHCRAGWVVALAGDAGRAMEWCLGTPTAAALIYIASDPKLERIPDFYATKKDALADMKRLAEAERST